jgi:hypothetical protein
MASKSNGKMEEFRQDKISAAILKALTATKARNGGIARRLSDQVLKILNLKIDANSLYNDQTMILGNNVKNFVIIISNEAHESLNQPP